MSDWMFRRWRKIRWAIVCWIIGARVEGDVLVVKRRLTADDITYIRRCWLERGAPPKGVLR